MSLYVRYQATIDYYKARSRLWKRAAKQLRKDFYIAQGSFLDAMKLLREAEATATRRLELLKRVLYLHSDFQGVPSYTLDVLLKDIEKELEDD